MNTETPQADARKDYHATLTLVQGRYDTLKDKWHKSGETTWKIYDGDENGVPFNILYSNTETIVPAVFSQKPLARVSRRHDEARADIPAKAVQRYLSFAMDKNLPSYPAFMTAIEDSVLDAALPGQGLFRVRLVGKVSCLDYVPWNMFVWGYAKRWEDVPWIAFLHDMEPEALLAQFENSMSEGQVVYFKSKTAEASSDSEKTLNGEKAPDTIRVYEVWDKRTKMVRFLCEAAQECLLEEQLDPLRLENFYPIPKPLKFLHNTTDTLPRPLYRLYQEQAEELNEITRRLTKIIKAIKVRGLYASGLSDIETVLKEDDDNVLVPSQAASNVVSTGKGLDAYIWLIPTDKLMATAQQLYQAREAVKGTIYEILGIGDILRGVTKASETLGAQQLKDKWGSLRINKLRERTTEFVREGLRLLAEVAIKHMPAEEWEACTGMKLQPPIETAIAQNTGAPPAQGPTWAGVLATLQNDLQRAYLIDIETNSSVAAEATEDKAEMAEFMNAFGQAMSGLKDVMMSSPQGWETGKAILLAITAKFDLGEDMAAKLSQLPPPQALMGPPPEVQKMMEDIQKKTQELNKQGALLATEEQTMKDIMAEVRRTQDALKAQEEAADMEHKQRLRDIEFATKESVMEIREEKMAVDQLKMQVEAKAAQVKQAQANPPAGRQPQKKA